MNTDKLVKAIQIIVKQELKEVIPPLVKEGVKQEMSKLLKEERVKKRKTSVTKKTKTNTEPNFMSESVVEDVPNTNNTKSNKVFSKNPVINEILQQTKPFESSKKQMTESTGDWKTMNFDTSDTHTLGKGNIMQQQMGGNPSGPNKGGLGVNTGVAGLDRILNRDNSELVKAFNRNK